MPNLRSEARNKNRRQMSSEFDVHAAPTARGATAAMVVLTAMNLLNYVDR